MVILSHRFENYMPFRVFLIEIQDGGFQQEIHQNGRIFCTETHIFETEFLEKRIQKWKDNKGVSPNYFHNYTES